MLKEQKRVYLMNIYVQYATLGHDIPNVNETVFTSTTQQNIFFH